PVLGQAGDDASRVHTESDLRIYLAWCAERSVDPLAVERAQVELYVRWMQEARRFKPSTVSRRMSVVAGFYRTCVIEGVLDHASPGYRQATRPAQHRQVGWAILPLLSSWAAGRTCRWMLIDADTAAMQRDPFEAGGERGYGFLSLH